MTDILAGDVVVRAIGWAILLSLWQGALIGVLTALLLRSMRAASASLRYAVACLGLAALTLSWIVAAVTYAADARRAPIPDDLARVELFAPDTSPVPVSADPPVVTVPAGAPASDLLEEWWPRLESWSVAVVPVWFVGILILSARLIAVWLLVVRLRRAATQPIPDVWLERVRGIATLLRVSRPVRLAQSAVVQVPMVIGWLRPVILLPASVFSGLTVGQLEAVIAHELAHVRRYDYAVNIAQTVVEILLFYHPATWWISRQIRVEREHCCDDVAVTLGGSRVAYATALADLEALRSETSAIALAATNGPLLRRIQRLVDPAFARSSWSAICASATTILAVVVLVVMRSTPAGTHAPDADSGQGLAFVQTIPSTEGVIQGHVLDAQSSRPVPNATIDVLGERQTTTVASDDEGSYQAAGLAPGQYRVQARAGGYAARFYGQRARSEPPVAVDVHGGRLTNDVDVRLEAAGSISGRVFDERGEGLAGVEVELVTRRYVPGGTRLVGVGFAQTEALGLFRIDDVLAGDYYVRAYVSGRLPPGPADALREIIGGRQGPFSDDARYRVTFYPNVPSMDAAQTLHVSAGQELLDVNLTLVASPTYRVAGAVIDPGGAVAGTQVHLKSIGASSTQTEYTAIAGADGRFDVHDVMPGDYMVTVRGTSPRFASRWMAAYREITVDDDVVGLELQARLGASIEGRIARDAGVTRPFDASRVRVRFERRLAQEPMGGPMFFAEDAPVRADATFSTNSPGGPSSIRIVDLPAQWTVKAVRVDGVEIGDQPVDFGEGGRRRLEIVVTDRVSRISGTVVDGRDRPVSNASVVIFASDPARWIAASKYVRETRSRTGQFLIEALPPEDYLAVAIDGLSFNAWFDPEVLERLRPAATRVRVGEGEQRVVSLRLSPLPPSVMAQTTSMPGTAVPSPFSAQWSGASGTGSVRSAGTVVFTDDLRDVKSLSDDGFLFVENRGVLSSRRVEIRVSNGAMTRKYYVDSSEQPWTGEAGRWLADNLPFFVRRSGVGARERVQQLLAARGLDAVLHEIGLLYTDSVRGRYLRALFDSGLLDAAAMNVPLLLAANSMSSSHELAETVLSALQAGFQEGDGFFRVVDRISSSVEKRRVLMALLDRPRLTRTVQLATLAAAAEIESNTECATVLDAFASRYPVADPEMRDAFLAALKTVDSGSARARLLARLDNR